MSEVMRYVAGFAFSRNFRDVALVRKERPDWQAGRLNGIGGKIEAGETPAEAMVREFQEETGLATAPVDWEEVVELSFPGGVVHFFRAALPDLGRLRTTTDEQIVVVPSLPVHEDALANLHWLIPLCLDGLQLPIRLQDREEGAWLAGVVESSRSLVDA